MMEAGAVNGPMLELRGVRKYFQSGRNIPFLGSRQALVRAVDGVSFTVQRRQLFGLVGESGCGKSTLAKLILRLDDPTEGSILFEGQDVHQIAGPLLRRFRRATHIVFQDPNSSLNPRMRVGDIISEPIRIHGLYPGDERKRRVAEVLELVGLSPAAADQFPHEFSGGQRQRVAIARAISSDPEFIVLDEPVSALDVSIRAQILNLLKDLQERLGLTYLMIAHDLAAVYHACDVIGVMYLGKLVEVASSEDLYASPQHPYTRGLLSAIPQPDPTRRGRRSVLTGEIPSPVKPPSGCRFHTRCQIALSRCFEAEPEFREIQPGHRVACHLI